MIDFQIMSLAVLKSIIWFLILVFILLIAMQYKRKQKYTELSEIEPKKVKIMEKPYYQCICCGDLQDKPFNRILIEGYGSSVGCVCSQECLDKMLKL